MAGCQSIRPTCASGDFLTGIGVDLPVLLNPHLRTARAWGVGGIPMTFVVDAEGRARFSAFGARNWSAAESNALEGLLSEAESVR